MRAGRPRARAVASANGDDDVTISMLAAPRHRCDTDMILVMIILTTTFQQYLSSATMKKYSAIPVPKADMH